MKTTDLWPTLSLSRTVKIPCGWSIFSTSLFDCLNKITQRITLIPPPVEPEHPPIKQIRNKIASLYENEIAQNISILYGGSVNSQNAKELFDTSDIDGALVGGASLKVDEFDKIIKAI